MIDFIALAYSASHLPQFILIHYKAISSSISQTIQWNATIIIKKVGIKIAFVIYTIPYYSELNNLLVFSTFNIKTGTHYCGKIIKFHSLTDSTELKSIIIIIIMRKKEENLKQKCETTITWLHRPRPNRSGLKSTAL